MKKLFFALLMLSLCISCIEAGNRQNDNYQSTPDEHDGNYNVIAQGQNYSYYASADGKKGAALKTALYSIISSHDELSYSDLWNCYKETDVTDEGYIWDMYSNITKYQPGGPAQGRSYSGEGDSYNREHSVPQSWFNEQSPMKTDLYHVVPTDGYVNNRRGNNDFGEIGSLEYQSYNGFSRLGSPSASLREDGCTDSKVFEPNDIYKGDFARIYFYMATCYENRIASWSGTKMLNGTKYPCFSGWAQKMLLRWAENDPVSKKETDRVEAVCKIQKNRNPFVDFPGLEQYIWGAWQDSIFSLSHYRIPYARTSVPDESGSSESETSPIPIGDYVLLESEPQNWEGTYLIAWNEGGNKMRILDGSRQSLDEANNVLSILANDNTIASNANTDAASFQIASTSTKDWYSIRSASGYYIGKSSKKNGLEQSKTYTEVFGHQLSIEDGNAILKSTCGYTLRFNDTQNNGNRFRYYNGSQNPILLFRKTTSTKVDQTTKKISSPHLYSLDGQKLSKAPRKGLYVKGTRKVLAK